MLRKKTDITKEALKDLGFGTKVTQQTKLRLLTRGGSFNVERHGLPVFQSLSLNHSLLNMSWLKFNLTVFMLFIGVNARFAVVYLLCGIDSLTGLIAHSLAGKFFEAFFFSGQTFTTVGYGHITPNGIAANIVATLDAFFGLLGFALATGLLFAKFSKPTAKILFSNSAIMAPYQDITAWEFRIANQRSNQLIELKIRVLFSRMQKVNGKRIRRFNELHLERQIVAFLPLHLTVVHPIDETSPLFGFTKNDLDKSKAEFLILETATDDTFAQTVHARTFYRYDELFGGQNLVPCFNTPNLR